MGGLDSIEALLGKLTGLSDSLSTVYYALERLDLQLDAAVDIAESLQADMLDREVPAVMQQQTDIDKPDDTKGGA